MRLAAALLLAFPVLTGTALGQGTTPTPTPTPTPTATPTPTPTPEPTKAEKKVLRDYRRDGVIEACEHKKKTLKQVLENLPPEADIDTPDLRPALEAAIEQHKSGDCEQEAEPTPTPTPSPTATAVPTASPAPLPDTSDDTITPLPPTGGNTKPPGRNDVKPLKPDVTPVPPAATPVPEATVPPEPTGPVATPEPVFSNSDDAVPVSLLVLAGLLVLLALAALLFGLAGRFGWAEQRLAPMRRSLREATFRAGGTWGDFADWVRLGR